MVDLPKESTQVVTSQQPRTSVTAGAIAAPYSELARGLDQLGAGSEKLGAGLGEVAKPLAAQEGAQAVTRGPDGQVQVAPHPFIVGAAGEDYARAVKVGAVAAAQNQAQLDNIQMRQDFADDPQGYMKAAGAYRTKIAQQLTDSAGPEVGAAVGRIIDNQNVETYGSLINTKQTRDLKIADNNIKGGIDQASTDLRNMARQGVTSGKAWDDATAQVNTLTDERVNAPNSTYTREMANIDQQQMNDEVKGQGFLYHVDQIYKNQNVDPTTRAKEALTYAQGILTDPTLHLTPEQREAFYHKAASDVHANEAIRRQDIGEARASYTELTTASALGQRIDPAAVENVANAYRQAGDPAGAARVYATFARKSLNDDFGRQPADERARQIGKISDNIAVPQQYRSLVQQAAETSGMDVSTLVRMFQQESGFNPNAVSPKGARGVAQFMPETAARYGVNPDDPNSAIPGAGRYLADIGRQFGGNTGLTLAAYNWGEGNVQKWMEGGADPAKIPAETRNYVQSITGAPIQAWLGGKSIPDINPASSAWLLANRQRTSDKASWDEWSEIMKDYDSEGSRPLPDRVNGIIQAARATGNASLLEQVGSDMNRISVAQDVSQQPLAAQASIIGKMKEDAAGGGVEPGHAALLKDLIRRDDAMTKGMNDNPVSTTVQNWSDKFHTPAPLNITDQKEFQQGLAYRGKIVSFGAEALQRGPTQALDKADVAAVQGALETADPPTKARILGDITAALPEQVRNATLGKIGEKDASMMTTVAAGGLQGAAPDVAASILRGQQAIKVDPRNNPNEGQNKQTFEDAVDKHLPSSIFSEAARTNPTGPYAMMRGAVTARVADMLADPASKKTVTDAMVAQAAQDVTGGVLDAHGSKIIAPQRGMQQGQFDATLAGLNDRDLPDVTTLSGSPVTAQYIRDNAQLESYGDGRYLVKIGTGYAVQGANDERGNVRPFVLDLRNRTPSPDYRARSSGLTIGDMISRSGG